jgi:hypothetical protein
MNRNLTGAAVLVAGAGLAAAGCGSSTSATTTRSGSQAIAGTVSGPAAVASTANVPLTLKGLVNTTGSIKLQSNSQQKTATITTGQGDLAVTHTAGHTSTRLLSTRTCKFSVGVRATYTVIGSKSTGKFKNARGSGDVTLLYTANLPKKSDGSCNVSASARPLPAHARVSFAAHGPLTLKQ